MGGDWPSLSNINQRQLHKLTDNPFDAIAWCQEHGLISRKRDCMMCGKTMKEVKCRNRNEDFRLKCRDRNCRTERGMRTGTFFENSKLGIAQMIDLMYSYSYETANVKNLIRECEISNDTIVKWRNNVRAIYAEYFVRNPLKIGGPGHIVEIDESPFVKRKGKTQWIFVGQDISTQECFLIAIAKRDPKTLLSVIEEYVLPGSTVVSDLWRSYGTINELCFQRLIVTLNLNFVDSNAHAKSVNLESLCLRAKERNKRECGIREELLPSYLTEFMWRQKFGNDPFQKLVEQIREIYPVNLD